MRLPKWLKKRKGKNPFKGSLIIDNPDIKVVEAKYGKKPVLLAIGTSKQRELTISGKGNTEGVGAQYQTQKDLDWKVLYNTKALPDFIPFEKIKDLMAGTIAVSSGNAAIFEPNTKYIETEEKKLESSEWVRDPERAFFHELSIATDIAKKKKTKEAKSEEEK